ncbi:MAG: hypothetical protein E7Z88_05370 [Cyanobacteria bacterium SIG27]|nr:hypothetical protein [Cyanobacteria bacterium SIG27]MBQ9150345.1 hypothetical protein [bacterium]
MVLRIVLILFLLSSFVFAKHLYPEKYYQDIWCKEQKGQTEVKLIDDTRIDCLTKTHAIEFDFASKWAEAIGQSLHYSNMTKRNAGIVLIIEKSDDYKYFNKIKPLCEKHQITLWEMKPPNKPIKTQEFYNLEKIIELIIGFIKALIKLFSNF